MTEEKQLKIGKLDRRQYLRLIIYTVVLLVTLVLIHECAHVLTAAFLGVPLQELKVGFWGVSPAVTLPGWFRGTPRIIVYYSGGFFSGTVLAGYYLFQLRRYYFQKPTQYLWAKGLITIALAATQFATGILEGQFHNAYVSGCQGYFLSYRYFNLRLGHHRNFTAFVIVSKENNRN